MKRTTVILVDEDLYRAVEAEAAREGRQVQDVVPEALSAWLRTKERLSSEKIERRRQALEALDGIRQRQKVSVSVQDLLDELRDERS